MAEGELNVDSLISRLLEGERFLYSLSCYTESAVCVHCDWRAIYSVTTAVTSENAGNVLASRANVNHS